MFDAKTAKKENDKRKHRQIMLIDAIESAIDNPERTGINEVDDKLRMFFTVDDFRDKAAIANVIEHQSYDDIAKFIYEIMLGDK